MTEGGLHQVFDRKVDIGRSRDDDRILPARFRKKSHLRFEREEEFGGFESSSEDHCRDLLVSDQVLTVLIIATWKEVKDFLRNSCLPEMIDRAPCDRDALWRGLEDHRISRSECCQDSTKRNCIREVPRRDDRNHTHRARSTGRGESAHRVIASEIDRLADLWISLGCGLSGIAGHDRDGLGARFLHHFGRLEKDLTSRLRA